MASSGAGRLLATPQPSSAFLLKCVKEQEKLRLALHKQLQQHMLDLFEGGLFADLELQGTLNDEPSCTRNGDCSRDSAKLLKLHKAIIQVRVPAFYECVCQLADETLSSATKQIVLPFVDQVHLSSFLKKVYSEDEIKSHECDIVKQSKERPDPEGRLRESDVYDPDGAESVPELHSSSNKPAKEDKTVKDGVPCISINMHEPSSKDDTSETMVNQSEAGQLFTKRRPSSSAEVDEAPASGPQSEAGLLSVSQGTTKDHSEYGSMPIEDSSTSNLIDPKTTSVVGGNADTDERSGIDTDTYDIASDMATAESIDQDRMSENSLEMSESDDHEEEEGVVDHSFPEGSPMENSRSSLGTAECHAGLSEDNGTLANVQNDLDSSLADDNLIEEKETPETPSQPSSMVRSGTFDLQCQMPLEKVLDSDEQEWNADGTPQSESKDDKGRDDIQDAETSAGRTQSVWPDQTKDAGQSQAFYLHYHPPTNKAEWLFQQDVRNSGQFSASGEAPAESHFGAGPGRLDGSMTDSGFLSQSASVLSETGLPGSLSSSLVASDSTLNSPPCTTSQHGSAKTVQHAGGGTTTSCSAKSEPIMHSPGSLFSYYIDMNNLPCEEKTKTKETKRKTGSSQSKSAVYMYIDASEMSVKDSDQSSGLGGSADTESPSKSDVEDSLEGHKPPRAATSIGSGVVLRRAKSEVRNQGLPRQPYSDEGVSVNATPKSRNTKQRPQSCYMFIDFGTGTKKGGSPGGDSNQQQQTKTRKRSPSLSMYVDVGKELSRSVHATTGNALGVSENKPLPFRAHSIERTDIAGNLPAAITFGGIKGGFNIPEQWPPPHHGFQRTKAEAVHTSDPENLSSFASLKEKTPKMPTGSTCSLRSESDLRKLRPPSAANPSLTVAEIKKSAVRAVVESSGTGQTTAVSLSNPEINFIAQQETPKKSKPVPSSTGDATKTEAVSKASAGAKAEFTASIEEEGLLPMSPILRRKNSAKKIVKPPVEEVVVKVSTRPQDIYAMTFRRPIQDDAEDDEVPPPVQRTQSKDSEGGNTSDNVSSQDSIEKLSNPDCDDNKNQADGSAITGVKSVTTTTADDSHVPAHPLPPHHPHPTNYPPSSDDHAALTRSACNPGETNQGPTPSRLSHSPLPRPMSCDTEDDTETVYSEVSDISASALQSISSGGGSMTQSKERQSPDGDSGHDSSFLHRTLEACSKLGEDLLRMFLEEISTDVMVQVEGRNIKAHKCILASRCKYFAAMLKGDWLESSGNAINLQGFSYSAVHFALCHIYSGAITVPKDVNIAELALIADMLALDSLKEVVAFHLKMNYCHFFHKPCTHCIVGVVECLPLTSSCRLTGLHDKALKWIGKYFVRVWPSKAFVSLNEELMEQCYQSTKQNIGVDSVIDMTLSCDRLMATLPRVKWAEPVFGLATKLLEECVHFMAQHFDQVLGSDGFLALGKGQSWNVTALEDNILSAVEALTPDTACKTYVQLGRVLPFAESEGSGECGEWTQNFLDMLKRIHRQCERFLIHNANRVVHCQSWALLAPEVQRRIKDAAVIVFEFEKPTAPPPRLSSLHRKAKKQQETERPTSFDKSFTFPNKTKLAKTTKKTKSPSANNINLETAETKTASTTSSSDGDKGSAPLEEDKAFSMIEVNKTVTKETKNSRLVKSEQIRIEQTKCHSVVQPKTTLTTTAASSAGASHPHVTESGGGSGRSHADIRMQAEITYQRTVPSPHKTTSSAARTASPSAAETNKVESVSEGVQTGEDDDIGAGKTCVSCVAGAKTKSAESQQAKEDKSSTSSSSSGRAEKKKMKLETTSVSVLRHSPAKSASRSSSQVAKVPPFTYKTDGRPHEGCTCHAGSGSATPRSISSLSPACTPSSECSSVKRMEHAITTGDLVAEIDAESSLVNHCLQEAELLEQELTRKLQRQRVWGESKTVFSSTGTSSMAVKLHSESTSSSRITRPALQKKSSTESRKIPTSIAHGAKHASSKDVHGASSKSDAAVSAITKGSTTRSSASRSRLMAHQRHAGSEAGTPPSVHCTHRTSAAARASSLGRSRSGSTTPRRVGSATSLQLSSSSESRMTKSAGHVWK